ncbi:MAG: hypothetical protein CL930_11115 [Deltaproteobacteria bacterium]|nr:hypothetical protein [Deltaproteobacteria bacterium]
MIPVLIFLSTASAEPLTLSYEQALETALARNPSLYGAKLDVDAADGALIAAKGIYDPMANLNTNTNQFTSESTREFGEVLSEFKSLNWTAGVSQFLPTGTQIDLEWQTTKTRFKYELRETGFIVESEEPLFESRMVASITQNILEGHRLASNLEGIRQAVRSQSIASAMQRAIRQQTLADTASAYWNTRTTRKMADIASLAVETAKEEQRIVLAQVEQGRLAPVEKSRVDASVVQAELDLLNAIDTAAGAEDALLVLIGELPGQKLILSTDPATPVPVELDLKSIETIALENNPELQSSRIREEAAEMARTDAKHRRLPQLDMTVRYGLVGYEPSTDGAAQELFEGELPEWSVGGNLSVPLLNRADRGQYMTAQANAAKARSDRENLERQTLSQVRDQVRKLEAAHKQLTLTEANLQLAQQTLGAERALREAGRVIQKDVLESIAAVDDARIALEQARGAYQLALIELERLKGTL